MRQAIAIDLGGTKIAWAIINEQFDLIQHHLIKTPETQPKILSALENIIKKAVSLADGLVGVGIGVAGLVDHGAGMIIGSPNLPLAGVALMDHLHSRFDLTILIDNDANLAILGELCAGAGRGKNCFLGLTVGTGVGGGIIIDGKLWRGHRGTAAEFGHIIVDPYGLECGCGNRGCLETRASGTAFERLVKQIAAEKPDSNLSRLAGGDFNSLTGPAAASAARAGDRDALAAMAEVGYWLGVGIGSLINAFDPELVIIGGGMAASLDLVKKTIDDQISATVVDRRSRNIPLIISRLENSAGLLGAAGLVFSQI